MKDNGGAVVDLHHRPSRRLQVAYLCRNTQEVAVVSELPTSHHLGMIMALPRPAAALCRLLGYF